MHYGLDPYPKRWIESPYEWVGKRDAVKDHMLRLYEAAPWGDWDVRYVPKSCNEQAFLATTELMRLFESKETLHDGLLELLCLNLKLLTGTLQELKLKVVRPQYMQWKYPSSQGRPLTTTKTMIR